MSSQNGNTEMPLDYSAKWEGDIFTITVNGEVLFKCTRQQAKDVQLATDDLLQKFTHKGLPFTNSKE